MAISTHGKKTSVALAVGDGRTIVARVALVGFVTEVSLTPCAVMTAREAAVASLRKGNLTVFINSEGCGLTTFKRKLEKCISEGTGDGPQGPRRLVVIANLVPQSDFNLAGVGVGEGDRVLLATDVATTQRIHVVTIGLSDIALIVIHFSIAL